MWKWLRRLLVFLLGLGVVLAIAGYFVLRHYKNKHLSPESITRQMEREYNARVQVAETKIHLFQQPAMLEIKGLRLAPRDEAANEGVDLAQRTILPDGQAKLVSDSILIEVDLWNFARQQKLELGQMLLQNLDARMVVDTDGYVDFDDLFDKPTIVEGKINGKKVKKPKVKLKDKLKEKEAQGRGLAELKKLNLPLLIGTAGLKNARISLVREDEQKSFVLENFDLMAEELDVDFKNLAAHNKITIRSRGKFIAKDLANNESWASLDFDLIAPLQPLDPVRQEVDPAGHVQLSLKKGSSVMARKLSEVLRGMRESGDSKTRAALDKYAGHFQSYHLGGEMQNDLLLKLVLDRELGVALEEDVLMGFPDYSLKIDRGARWEKSRMRFLVDYTLICSPGASQEVDKAIQSALRDELGAFGATLLGGSVRGILFDDKAQALLKMRIKGPRAQPKPEPLFMEQIEATLGKRLGTSF